MLWTNDPTEKCITPLLSVYAAIFTKPGTDGAYKRVLETNLPGHVRA